MADDMRQWLEALGLGRYGDVFAENEVGLTALPHITEDDLKEMGVALGARRQLLAAIAGMTAAGAAPPAERATVAGAAAAADAARRQVTALFADISGFTRLSNTMDAEETHAMLNGFFATVDEAVRRYGGTVDKHIGDAVMAVFGAPVAHTDDPERALRAALDIQDEVNRLQPPLHVHIGVASGQVVASSTGSAAHMEYTVTGDSVNLAARLTDMAEADETLASASVQRALGDRFIGANLGERPVAGLLEPVTVWRLDQLAAARADEGHAFVGRAAESEQFAAALQRSLKTGQGETVIVRGEAGIGKTRLVEEFANLATARGFAVHTGLVLDFGTAKGQDAIRALVRSLLDLAPGSDEAARAQAADNVVRGKNLPESRRIHLNDLLDLPQPAYLRGVYEIMDLETRNRGKQDTLGDLVRQASQSSPLLLRVEDVHWADPAILVQLAYLARIVAGLPALLILTTRVTGDRLDRDWQAGTAGAPLTTIDLGPLGASEAIELAHDFDALNEDVVAACVERSGGNPLFLEQLLRNADELTAGNIPGTIQGIVQARLDALPAGDRDAIQAASVLGQRFSRPALDAVLERTGYDPANLLENVLIRAAGEGYHFAHALIREGVYASMLRPRRTALHRRAAAWFHDSDPVLHAEHLDKAEEPGAAEAYLNAAGQEILAHRHERARPLVERALELDCPPRIRFELTCVHGDLLRELGAADQSIAAFQQAIATAADAAQSCRANIGLAEGLRIKSKYREGLECLVTAEAAAREIRSAELLSRIHGLKGNLYFPLGEIDHCVAEHEQALRYGRETGSAVVQARAFGGMADAHYVRGRMLSAGRMFERCVVLARENNLPGIIAANLTMFALTKFYTLEFAAGRAMFDEALQLSLSTGNYRAEIVNRMSSPYIMIEEASFEEALPFTQEATDKSIEYGLHAFTPHSMRNQASNFLEMGQPDKAIEMAERSWKLTVDHHVEGFNGAFCLGVIARASPDRDRQDWAIETGFQLLSKGAVSHNHLLFYRDVMEAGLARGDWGLLTRAADALREYTAPEPLPWSAFYLARAEALMRLHRGGDRKKAIAALKALKGQAEQAGLRIALPRIEDALREAAPK